MSLDLSNSKRAVKATASLPVLNAHAAGIDIGSTFMFVCVPTDSSATPFRKFKAYTEDLHALADWLKECAVRTVAMESTGVYWIPLYQILEDRGFEVTLVSPNYPKKPYKSDLADCQWLQYLHAVGLLSGSFRPAAQHCAVREILRQRMTLVRQAGSHIQRMQKALTQMNLLLHNVISDITGITGLAIVDAILDGERNPQTLSLLRDHRIKSSSDTIAKSLVGDYRPEHLFTLQQNREAYQFIQKQMAECDSRIEQMLQEFDDYGGPNSTAGALRKLKAGKNEIRLSNSSLQSEMHRINGVDLTMIPGLGAVTVHALFCEVGSDLSAFASAAHFASWLGLCPENRISGGKVLSKKTRSVKSRAAAGFRQAAQSLARSNSYFGDFYRRIKNRLGPVAAITALAHKLAKIYYLMITTKKSYDENAFSNVKAKYESRKLHNIEMQAQARGFKLVPA